MSVAVAVRVPGLQAVGELVDLVVAVVVDFVTDLISALEDRRVVVVAVVAGPDPIGVVVGSVIHDVVAVVVDFVTDLFGLWIHQPVIVITVVCVVGCPDRLGAGEDGLVRISKSVRVGVGEPGQCVAGLIVHEVIAVVVDAVADLGVSRESIGVVVIAVVGLGVSIAVEVFGAIIAITSDGQYQQGQTELHLNPHCTGQNTSAPWSQISGCAGSKRRHGRTKCRALSTT